MCIFPMKKAARNNKTSRARSTSPPPKSKRTRKEQETAISAGGGGRRGGNAGKRKTETTNGVDIGATFEKVFPGQGSWTGTVEHELQPFDGYRVRYSDGSSEDLPRAEVLELLGAGGGAKKKTASASNGKQAPLTTGTGSTDPEVGQRGKVGHPL